ncbi:hypothetical protein [Deinococcus sp. RIT780]|uniref:hypothetical protein n=1 Tax=Deinococcus sp. RIT780 TaxID=2870472 RepID=UPI001C8A1A67|nr:hypothetical protein [Deinococcus sp. RIT780]
MTLLQEVGIYINGSLIIPVKTDWGFIPVRSDNGCLTDYIEEFINYSRSRKLVMRIEQYFPGRFDTEAAYEINALQVSNAQSISLIMREGYLCDTLIATSDLSAVLVATHTLTSFLIAKRSVIDEICGKSVLQMQHEYAEYINGWSGAPGKNAESILKLSQDYPELFIGKINAEIKFV